MLETLTVMLVDLHYWAKWIHWNLSFNKPHASMP